MAAHSSILAWRIPWAQEPGGLQSIGLQRVGHDWSYLALTWGRNRRGLPTEGCLLYSVSWLGCKLKGWVRFFKNHYSEYMTYPLSCIDNLNFSVSLHMWGSYKFTWYMCMHAQLCLTLCDPMDCSLPSFSVEFSRQEYWGGLPFSTPGGPSDPGIKPPSPVPLALASGLFYHWATWEAYLVNRALKIICYYFCIVIDALAYRKQTLKPFSLYIKKGNL